jgi:hypothetical protein
VNKPLLPLLDYQEVQIEISDALKVISRAHYIGRVFYDSYDEGPRDAEASYPHVAQSLDHPALDHLFAQIMPDLTKALRSHIDGYEYAVLSNLSACGVPADKEVPILCDWEAVIRDPFTTDVEARRAVKQLLAEMAVAHARHRVQETWCKPGRGKHVRENQDGWAFFEDFAISMTDAFNTLTMKPRRFGDFGGHLVSRNGRSRWLPELNEGYFDMVLKQDFTNDVIRMSSFVRKDQEDIAAPVAPTL